MHCCIVFVVVVSHHIETILSASLSVTSRKSAFVQLWPRYLMPLHNFEKIRGIIDRTNNTFGGAHEIRRMNKQQSSKSRIFDILVHGQNVLTKQELQMV